VIRALAFVLLATADRYPSASRTAQSPALAPCPDTPNCVSTAAADSAKRMAAWPFTVPVATARAAVEQIVRAHPRTHIIDTREDYVHATFTSRIFRFVDDVEFRIDTTTRTVHFRSASRVGHSDLGVNRRRMTALREDFLRSVRQ
jgi:uncharacterized protein (DUF1499 family)